MNRGAAEVRLPIRQANLPIGGDEDRYSALEARPTCIVSNDERARAMATRTTQQGSLIDDQPQDLDRFTALEARPTCIISNDERTRAIAARTTQHGSLIDDQWDEEKAPTQTTHWAAQLLDVIGTLLRNSPLNECLARTLPRCFARQHPPGSAIPARAVTDAHGQFAMRTIPTLPVAVTEDQARKATPVHPLTDTEDRFTVLEARPTCISCTAQEREGLRQIETASAPAADDADRFSALDARATCIVSNAERQKVMATNALGTVTEYDGERTSDANADRYTALEARPTCIVSNDQRLADAQSKLQAEQGLSGIAEEGKGLNA
jgi:hypothetical protein